MDTDRVGFFAGAETGLLFDDVFVDGTEYEQVACDATTCADDSNYEVIAFTECNSPPEFTDGAFDTDTLADQAAASLALQATTAQSLVESTLSTELT